MLKRENTIYGDVIEKTNSNSIFDMMECKEFTTKVIAESIRFKHTAEGNEYFLLGHFIYD